LLLLGPEPSVFSSVVKKSKNLNIQDYNFACGFVWMQNLVSDTKGGTLTGEMFQNRVLRRIFGRKRDEVTGQWRKVCLWFCMGVKLGL
jgi:hypothetical protein